jgi:hypothetical protein
MLIQCSMAYLHIYLPTRTVKSPSLSQPDDKPNEIPDQTISFIRIEKSPFSQWRRNSKVNSFSGSHRKNQTREDRNKQKTKNTHRYEQKCESHTCSGTINSSMYDRDNFPTDFISSLQWVKANDEHQPMNWVSAKIPEAMGRLSHTTG